MEGPLAGVRVLEVANWLAAPAECALLADFGAQVVKVEPPGGDPYRGFRPRAYSYQASFNFAFELDNRGKKGMTLNLEQPAARVGARGPAPELGQHTEEILLESGYSWDEIVKLRGEGVI